MCSTAVSGSEVFINFCIKENKNMVNKKIREITCNEHEDFKQIHLLNGIKLRKELYKYIKIPEPFF